VAFPQGRIANVPVSTYLFVAVLVAQGQGASSVAMHLDGKDQLVHGDHELRGDDMVFALTTSDAVCLFEQALWRVWLQRGADPYTPGCGCTLDACEDHRLKRDQKGKCNQNCHRYVLYNELSISNRNKARPFYMVQDTNKEEWESIASQIRDVSFICFGGDGVAPSPVDEDTLAWKIRDFLRVTTSREK
jgi:hypothetical protein